LALKIPPSKLYESIFNGFKFVNPLIQGRVSLFSIRCYKFSVYQPQHKPTSLLSLISIANNPETFRGVFHHFGLNPTTPIADVVSLPAKLLGTLKSLSDRVLLNFLQDS
jgi:hypothetical protein